MTIRERIALTKVEIAGICGRFARLKEQSKKPIGYSSLAELAAYHQRLKVINLLKEEGYLSPEEVGTKVYNETRRQRDKRKQLREWCYKKIEEANKQERNRVLAELDKLTVIGDRQCLGEVWEKGNAYVCDVGEVPTMEQYYKWGAQAQLQSDIDKLKEKLE